MAAKGAAQRTHAGGVHNLRPAGDCGDGHASTERFGHGDEVRLDAEVFAGEPFSGARETGLHFIGDKKNSVLAANFLQQSEITFWRDYEAAFAQDWFGDDRGHRLWRDAALECVFEVMREGFRRSAFFAAIRICKRDA